MKTKYHLPKVSFLPQLIKLCRLAIEIWRNQIISSITSFINNKSPQKTALHLIPHQNTLGKSQSFWTFLGCLYTMSCPTVGSYWAPAIDVLMIILVIAKLIFQILLHLFCWWLSYHYRKDVYPPGNQHSTCQEAIPKGNYSSNHPFSGVILFSVKVNTGQLGKKLLQYQLLVIPPFRLSASPTQTKLELPRHHNFVASFHANLLATSLSWDPLGSKFGPSWNKGNLEIILHQGE